MCKAATFSLDSHIRKSSKLNLDRLQTSTRHQARSGRHGEPEQPPSDDRVLLFPDVCGPESIPVFSSRETKDDGNVTCLLWIQQQSFESATPSVLLPAGCSSLVVIPPVRCRRQPRHLPLPSAVSII